MLLICLQQEVRLRSDIPGTVDCRPPVSATSQAENTSPPVLRVAPPDLLYLWLSSEVVLVSVSTQHYTDRFLMILI